jgi:hypothetical protein
MQEGTQFAGIAWCGLDSAHVAKVPQDGFFGKRAILEPRGRKKKPGEVISGLRVSRVGLA